MFLDALLQFDPAGTAITVTAASTNVLDMTAQRDMGLGEPALGIVVLVQEAFAAAGAATLQIAAQGAVDNAGVPGTFYDFGMSGVLPKANLILGRVAWQAALPLAQPAASDVDTPPRFYRLNYTVGTGPFTAGKVESSVVPLAALGASLRNYATAINVSN